MEHITLRQLNYNVRNAQISALLICKQNPNTFNDKAVMEITLRDSVEDYVNCTIWGSETYIESFNNLKIGDLVTITYPQIKTGSGESTIYSPQSSSIFSLTINEGCGDIFLNTDIQEKQRLAQFAKIPITNGIKSLVQLADIISFRGNSTVTKKCVDLLVCVRVLKPQRQITTKLGKKLIIREVIVFDQSSNGMLLNCFNEHFSEIAENWNPYNTILYLNDVTVEYSDFHHTAILKIAKKTLITEDPKIRKAYDLLMYAKRFPRDMDISFSTESGVPELSSITHVMSVEHLYELGQTENSNEEQFTAVLYAVVTKYDIDGSNQSRVVKKRCVNCNRYVPLTNQFCANEDCDAYLDETFSDKFLYYYDIHISLSDHSGSINCRILKEYAEMQLIRCPAKEFLELDEQQKTDLKLNLLMERCRVKIVLRRKSVLRASMTIIVLECIVADFDEATRKITVY